MSWMKGARYTMKRNRLFLPIFSWAFGHLHLPGLAGEVAFARFLRDGSEVRRVEVDPCHKASTVQMGGLPKWGLAQRLAVRQPVVICPSSNCS